MCLCVVWCVSDQATVHSQRAKQCTHNSSRDAPDLFKRLFFAGSESLWTIAGGLSNASLNFDLLFSIRDNHKTCYLFISLLPTAWPRVSFPNESRMAMHDFSCSGRATVVATSYILEEMLKRKAFSTTMINGLRCVFYHPLTSFPLKRPTQLLALPIQDISSIYPVRSFEQRSTLMLRALNTSACLSEWEICPK